MTSAGGLVSYEAHCPKTGTDWLLTFGIRLVNDSCDRKQSFDWWSSRSRRELVNQVRDAAPAKRAAPFKRFGCAVISCHVFSGPPVRIFCFG